MKAYYEFKSLAKFVIQRICSWLRCITFCSRKNKKNFCEGTMEDQRNISVDHCVVEMTAGKRDKENAEPLRESTPFVFQGSECHIRIRSCWETTNERKIRIYLKSHPPLSPNFYATVFVYKENNMISYPKIKVLDNARFFWSSSFHELSKQLKGAEDWNLNFRFAFQKESELNFDKKDSGNKGVQTSEYLYENGSQQRLSEDLDRLFDSGSDHDVELTSGEMTVKAHKCILKARSRYFENMLLTATDGQIDLPYVDPAAFHEITRYIYTGKSPDLSSELAKKIYKSGNMCDCEGLKKLCVEFMIENLTLDNACEFLALATDDYFKERITAYIIEKNIPYLDEYWKPFCDEHPKSANDVLNKLVRRLRPRCT